VSARTVVAPRTRKNLLNVGVTALLFTHDGNQTVLLLVEDELMGVGGR
jgi:hypothetical protein